MKSLKTQKVSSRILPVHPFPARMAPEIALKHLSRKTRKKRLTVLDPMMGSGTIPVIAASTGHRAIGYDVDPLAVMVSNAWGKSLNSRKYLAAVKRVIDSSKKDRKKYKFEDKETQEYANFWFDAKVQQRLHALSVAISNEPKSLLSALWCAFSKLIITKNAGASRARDVSHSRPHRVREFASFDPRDEYLKSAKAVLKRHVDLGESRSPAISLRRADARKLPLPSSSVDVVLTSPPYLQAIDYLRGHKLALIWMGHTIPELRKIRSSSIGSERGYSSDQYQRVLNRSVTTELDRRSTRIALRYIFDLDKVIEEMSRVVKKNGHITFVVAEATICGNSVKVSEIVCGLASRYSWKEIGRFVRPLEVSRRYLPPPTKGKNSLDKRMKEEVCITFSNRR